MRTLVPQSSISQNLIDDTVVKENIAPIGVRVNRSVNDNIISAIIGIARNFKLSDDSKDLLVLIEKL